MTTPGPRSWPEGTAAEHMQWLTELYAALPDAASVLVPLAVVRRVHLQRQLDVERLADAERRADDHEQTAARLADEVADLAGELGDCMARRATGGLPPEVTSVWGNGSHPPPATAGVAGEHMAPPARYGSSTPRSTTDA
jgi:hypothetical protein